jgi:hypothetical protein
MTRRYGSHRRPKNQNPRGACARAWQRKSVGNVFIYASTAPNCKSSARSQPGDRANEILNTTRRGREPAGRAARLAHRAGNGKRAVIKISHSVTRDCLAGQAWPPPDSNTLWVYGDAAGADRSAAPRRTLTGEPAAGRGAIVRVLRDAGHAVIASGINPCVGLHFVRDFLLEAESAYPRRSDRHQPALPVSPSVGRARPRALPDRDHAPAAGLPGIGAAHTDPRSGPSRPHPRQAAASDDAPHAGGGVDSVRVVRLGPRSPRPEPHRPHFVPRRPDAATPAKRRITP